MQENQATISESKMINLREYFIKEIGDLSPYKKYKDFIENGYSDFILGNYIPEIILPITTSTEEDLINSFKSMVQPSNSYSMETYYEFILVCFYLDKKGYFITQFPNQLSNPVSLKEFANDKIRTHLIVKGFVESGTVKWDSRRELISELEFKKRQDIKTNFNEEIEESFRKISTRNSSFDEMSNGEKLKEISNLIEYKLKINKQFQELNEENTLNLLNNKDLMNYRKLTQCYRHSSEDNLLLRIEYKNKELFLIHYGIAFLHSIFEN